MDRPIFNLIYVSWDWERTYCFYGPEGSTKEQFEDLCEKLLPKAGYRAVRRQVRSDSGSWVTWSDVVESLIPLLQEQGYQLFELPKVEINCSGIIGISSRTQGDYRLGFANKLIYDYNHALDEKIRKETEKKPRKGRLKKFIPQIMK